MPPQVLEQKPPAVDPDTLAKAIVKLSSGVTSLIRSGLNEDAVVILLHHETKLPQRDIRNLIRTMGDLARKYTAKVT